MIKPIYIYALFSLAIVGYMIFLLTLISKTKIEYKKTLMIPICVAVVALISYTLFLLSEKHFVAVVFNGIYYICTDWLTFTLFLFFSDNIDAVKNRKKIAKVFLVLAILDSVNMAINTFTRHSFDLVPSVSSGGMKFWGLDFTIFHYIHLGLCYVMAVCAFVVLILNIRAAPRFYRRKYISYLVAYLVVLICNFHSYSMNLPIDYSVLLYGVFATFLAIYSIWTFPAYLVTSVMERLSESVADAIVHFDYEGNVIYQNDSARQLFNSKTGTFKISPAELKERFLDKADEKTLKWENEVAIFSVDLNLKNERNEVLVHPEEIKHFRVAYQELKVEKSAIGSYIKISDKTEEKLRYQKERYTAIHDGLTGLLNRSGFFEKVEQQIHLGTFKNPIMVCSNIRDFKIVNDIFGETVGDEILIRHAKVLKERAQENDINGRLGDDKFAVFMEKDHFNSDGFMQIFRDLGTISESNSYRMFIAAGIYEVRDLNEKAQVMYDKAKVAMDTIKEDYLTMLAFYDSTLMDKLLAEKNIINNFENAILTNQFEMYLQPIFDKDGNVISAEALARWNSPETGMIYPEDFIEILSNTGLVYKLDKIIAEKAVQKFAEWKKKGYKIQSIALNAASKDEYYFDTISFLKSLAEKYEISPDSVVIEVLEDAFINDYENEAHYFERLKAAGFKITIDDFGSGFSSLNMLKDFNIDAVKISADFFSGKFSTRAEIILGSMLEMVKELKIQAAALGIENEDQKTLLENLGCSVFQGYLFSKPIPADEFEEKFLKK